MDETVQKAMESFHQVNRLLKQFSTETEAVAYLARETGLPEEECAAAYRLLSKMDPDRSEI